MASSSNSHEELTDFFQTLETLFRHIQQSLSVRDPLYLELCKSKLERSIPIVSAILLVVNNNTEVGSEEPESERPSLGSLLEGLISAIEEQIERLRIVLESSAVAQRRAITSFLPSTGGRPAFNITKELIEQLRETGMNWKSIARFLGVSERTLHRRRIEYGIEDSYTDITDNDLDNQITDILRLTPYSGECYVRGSLKSRSIHVQRALVRESLVGLTLLVETCGEDMLFAEESTMFLGLIIYGT